MTASCLVVGPAWVGDMVIAHALFQTLHAQDPTRPIDVLAPAWTHPLLARMPEVRQAIVSPFGHGALQLRQRYRFSQTLSGAHYQQAYVLPQSFKSALIPWWADIPERIGWRGEMRYGVLTKQRRLDKQAFPLTVQRFVALADLHAPAVANPPSPYLTVDSVIQAAVYAKFHIEPNKPLLVLCPGAEFGPSKRWPERHYITVAQAYIAQGWQVCLLGSPKDRPVLETIHSGAHEKTLQLGGNTTLSEAIDIIAGASRVITNDSGLMHVAAALQRPLVALYGSSDPSMTPPLYSKATILHLDLPCRPCFKRECPLGHQACLQNLIPAQVLHALECLPSCAS